MEIARLEVSTQHHLERMQETAKVNYVQYGKSTKSKKKKPQSSAGASGQGAGGHNAGAGHRGSRPSGKFNKRPPLLPDTCYRCGKGRHQKAQDCKAVDATCRGCGKKGHYEKVCLKGKCSAHSQVLQVLIAHVQQVLEMDYPDYELVISQVHDYYNLLISTFACKDRTLVIHISFYIKPKKQEPLFLYDIRTIPVPYHMNEELIDESEVNTPIPKSYLQKKYW